MGNETSTVQETAKDGSFESSEQQQQPPHPDLNELCRKRDWPSVIQLAHLSSSIYEKTIAADNIPLHTAVSNYAPLEVVHALVFAYPPSVSYQNRFGNTALHFAVWKNRGKESLRVVQFLLDYYPQSVKIVNNTDNLPLHWAAKFEAPLPIVQVVYRSHPGALEAVNNKSETPLELAIKRLGEKHPTVVMFQGEDSQSCTNNENLQTAEEALTDAEIWSTVDILDR